MAILWSRSGDCESFLRSVSSQICQHCTCSEQSDVQDEWQAFIEFGKGSGNPAKWRGDQDNAHIHNRLDASAFLGLNGEYNHLIHEWIDHGQTTRFQKH